MDIKKNQRLKRMVYAKASYSSISILWLKVLVGKWWCGRNGDHIETVFCFLMATIASVGEDQVLVFEVFGVLFLDGSF